MYRGSLVILGYMAIAVSTTAFAASVGTAFSYQGHLEDGGGPVTDTCSFRFGLWSASVFGTQKGVSPQTKAGVSVVGGVFTVPDLDFGPGAIDGTARWLAIEVQCTGDAGFNLLSPRVELTPAPHALALPGLYTQENSTSPNIIGGYSGNTVATGVVGATISGGGKEDGEPPFGLPNRHSVNSSYGTVGGGLDNIAGTTGDFGYATVGGGRSNAATRMGSTVGGGLSNAATDIGSTVGGGGGNQASGYYSTVAGGNSNAASAMHSTAGGGRENTAGVHGECAGGDNHGLLCTSDAECPGGLCIAAATIGGGYSNTVSGPSATVGGGSYNTAGGRACEDGFFFLASSWRSCDSDLECFGGTCEVESGTWATVAGGVDNEAISRGATVGGGQNNNAVGPQSTVGGGVSNSAFGTRATVAGGFANRAVAHYATIPGGSENLAGGVGSFAAGTSAEVRDFSATGDSDGDEGTFVWSDNTTVFPDTFASTGPNQFLVKATGGVGINTNAPGAALHIVGNNVRLDDYGTAPVFLGRRAGGTESTPSAPLATNILGQFGGAGFVGPELTDFTTVRGYFEAAAAENWSTTAQGTYLRFVTTPIGGTTPAEQMRIDDGGNVGIGTSAPSATLDVAGSLEIDATTLVANSSTNRVGIGTAAPAERLHVTGTTDTAALFENNDSTLADATVRIDNAHAAGIALYTTTNSSDANVVLANEGAGSLFKAFSGAGGANLVFEIENNGFTGVARSNPSHPLHVGSSASNGNGAHVTIGGTWTNGSSRDFKEKFEPIDKKQLLQKLVDLPVARWQYKNEGDTPNLHIGPVAEDFRSAFGLGHDERYITTVDADGVALAAIQGLYEIVEERDCRIDELEGEKVDLEARVAVLEAMMRRVLNAQTSGSH